jgi:hypothetical protein
MMDPLLVSSPLSVQPAWAGHTTDFSRFWLRDGRQKRNLPDASGGVLEL